eukprot:PhM_4_TR827/c0_g1_i1/m.4832
MSFIQESTLNFIFAMLFVFVILVFYTLYSANLFAWTLTRVFARFFLPSDSYFRVGSFAFAPLQCRIFLKNLHFFDSNVGVKITDAYITFRFWGKMFREEGWRGASDDEILKVGQKVRFRNPATGKVTKAVVCAISVTGEITVVIEGTEERHVTPRRVLQLEDYTGRLSVHLNGLEITMYNSVARYDALRRMAAGEATEVPLEQLFDLTSSRQKTLKERVMQFLRRVDVDVRCGTLAMGCLVPSVPYFLHMSFTHCIGSYFITSGEFMDKDNYRNVVDLTFRSVGMQWVPTDRVVKNEEKSSADDKATQSRLRRFRREVMASANLMLAGDSQFYATGGGDVQSYDADYCTILEKSDHPAMHIVYYWDDPGIEEMDDVVRPHADLAKTGLEIEIDAKRIIYGPFSDLQRKLITQHFLPWDYKSWPLYKAKRGALRPVGLFEMRLDFVRDCVLFVPFKHKTVSPQLPYGIKDSGKMGNLTVHLGKGSHYVYSYPWIMHETEKTIICETFFRLERVHVFTSLNNSCLFTAGQLDVHLDSLYPQHIHEKQEWDIILRFRDTNMWYLSDHTNFFFDVMADWGYAGCMYGQDDPDKYWQDKYHFSEFVPYTCRYEVFFDGGVKIHLNANEHNIMYNPDHCAGSSNTFVTLHASDAQMCFECPYDQYCIFQDNEYKYSIDIVFKTCTMSLSLPNSHTLHSQLHGDRPFITTDTISVGGYYSSMYPNMSLPMSEQDKSRMKTNTTPGLANSCNTCLLSIKMDDTRGNIMGHHIAALSSVYKNFFSEEASFVTPEEYARFQHHGENIKYAMFTYLTRNDFRANDLDMTVELEVKDLVLDLDVMDAPMKGTIRTTSLEYAMHFSATLSEQTITSSPIIVDFSSQSLTKSDFIVVKGVQLWTCTFFSAAPNYLPYHTNMKTNIDVVTASLEPDTIAFLGEYAGCFTEPAYDSELRDLMKANPPVQRDRLTADKVDRSYTHFRKPHVDASKDEEMSNAPRLDDPYTDPTVLQAFLEWYGRKADLVDEAARMRYNLSHATLMNVNVGIMTPTTEVMLALPSGAHYGYSSLHDANTDSRWSATIPDAEIKLFQRRTTELLETDLAGDFVELASLTAGFAVRRTICFGAGEGYVADQYLKQRNFLATHHTYYDLDGIGDAAAVSSDPRQKIHRRRMAAMEESEPAVSDVVSPTQVLMEQHSDPGQSSSSFASCRTEDEGLGSYVNSDDEGEGSDDDECEHHLTSVDNEPDDASKSEMTCEVEDLSSRKLFDHSYVDTRNAVRPLVEYHRFLRAYDRTVEGGATNVLSFARLAQHSNRKLGSLSGVPLVRFTPTRLLSRNSMTSSVFRASSTFQAVDVENNPNWALVFIDNERRSREQTSTYHWHVEMTRPVVAMFTPKSVKVLLELLVVYEKAVASIPRHLQTGTTAGHPPSSRAEVKKKMEWLYNYTTIFSVFVPSVKVNFIHALRGLEAGETPVYHSTLVVRNLNIVTSKEEPAKVRDNARAVQQSASICAETVCFLMQCMTHAGRTMPNAPASALDPVQDVLLSSSSLVLLASVLNVRVRGKLYCDSSDFVATIMRRPGAFTIKHVGVYMCQDTPEVVMNLVELAQSLTSVVIQATQGAVEEREAALDLHDSFASMRSQTRQQPPSMMSPSGSIGRSQNNSRECPNGGNCGEFTFVVRHVIIKLFGTSMRSTATLSSNVLQIDGITINSSRRKDAVADLCIVANVNSIQSTVYPHLIDAFTFLSVRADSSDVASSAGPTTTSPEDDSGSHHSFFLQASIKSCDFKFASTKHNFVQAQVTRAMYSSVSKGAGRQTSGGTFTRQRTTVFETMPTHESDGRYDNIISADTVVVRYTTNLTFLADLIPSTSDIPANDGTTVLRATMRGVAASMNASPLAPPCYHASWSSLLVEMPHRPNSGETILPQYRELISSWKAAFTSLKDSTRTSAPQPEHNPFEPVRPPFQILTLDLAKTEFRATLIEGSVVDFTLPRINTLTVYQDDATIRTRFHLAGPQLLSGEKHIAFPDVFLFLIQSTATQHVQCTAVIERLEADVSPSLFVHALSMYRKVCRDLVEYITSIKPDDMDTSTPSTQSSSASETSYDVTVHFLGASVRVESLQSEIVVDVRALRVYASSSGEREDNKLRWSATMPQIEIYLADNENTTTPTTTATTIVSGSATTNAAVDDNHTPEQPSTPQACPSEKFPTSTAAPFLWAHVCLAASATNFDDTDCFYDSPNSNSSPSLDDEPGAMLHRRSSFDTSLLSRSPSCVNAKREPTACKITHTHVTVTSLRMLLRSGAVEQLGRLVDEYTAEWSALEEGVMNETEELRLRLRTSTFYHRMIKPKLGKLQDLTSAQSSSSGNLESDASRWALITSVVVQNVSLVVPVGDNLFNRGVTRGFVCTCHPHAGTHTLQCLDKRHLIPSYAVKFIVSNISFNMRSESHHDTHNSLSKKVIAVHVVDLGAYFHEGTRLDARPPVQNRRIIIGGVGIMAEPSPLEHSKARNNVTIPEIVFKVKTTTTSGATSTDVHGSLSGPIVRVNPRCVLYLTDLVKDFSREGHNAPPSTNPQARPISTHAITFVLELTKGEVALHSWAPLPQGFSASREAMGVTRRVSFSQITQKKGVSMREERQQSSDSNTVMVIPLPLVCANGSHTTGVEGTSLCAHVNVAFTPIEIHPTSVILWQELQMLSSTWEADKLERTGAIISTLKLGDAQLSLPRAYIQQALEWVSATPHHARQSSTTSEPNASKLGSHNNSQTTLHLTLAPFRVSATCSPVSATSVSLSVEEQGSVNVLFVSKQRREAVSTSAVVSVRRAKLEVQTRMEVKFAEISLPDLVAEITPTRDTIHVAVALCDVKKDTCELVLRLTHASQIIMILDLWKQKAHDAKAALATYTSQSSDEPSAASGAAADDAASRVRPKSFALTVDLERVSLKTEIGTSNKQEFVLSKVIFFLSSTPNRCMLERRRNRHVLCNRDATVIDLSIAEVSVRFDGHITGSMHVTEGVVARLVTLGSSDDGTMPGMQTYLGVPNVRCTLRERHVKDVLSADVVGLQLRLYDESLPGTPPQHHVFVDASTVKTSLALSADFLVALNAIIAEAWQTFDMERTTARSKLDSHRFYTGGRKKALTDTLTHLAASDVLRVPIPHVGTAMTVFPTGQVRLLIRDITITLGDLGHGADAAGLVFSIQSLSTEYAQCLDASTMRKALQLCLSSWDVFRKSTDRKSSIIGAKGANAFDISVGQPLGSKEVTYNFGFRCEAPWHGSPHMVDFDVINKTVASYAAAAPTAPSGMPVQPLAIDDRVFKARRITRFAPELRVVSDAVINIDTVLGWLGMSEDAIPRLLYVNVADGLEAVVHGAYMATVPQVVLESDQRIVQAELHHLVTPTRRDDVHGSSVDTPQETPPVTPTPANTPSVIGVTPRLNSILE